MTGRTAIFASLLIAIGAHSTVAWGQNNAQLWRCGNSYSDQPCPGGKALPAASGPNEAERRAAEDQTRRIEQRADALERIRLRREHEEAEQARRNANDARRQRLAERREASYERVQEARVRKLEREPRRSSARVRDSHAKNPG